MAKHESESTYIPRDKIREYPKRHFRYLGFRGYLPTIVNNCFTISILWCVCIYMYKQRQTDACADRHTEIGQRGPYMLTANGYTIKLTMLTNLESYRLCSSMNLLERSAVRTYIRMPYLTFKFHIQLRRAFYYQIMYFCCQVLAIA